MAIVCAEAADIVALRRPASTLSISYQDYRIWQGVKDYPIVKIVLIFLNVTAYMYYVNVFITAIGPNYVVPPSTGLPAFNEVMIRG